MLAELAYSPNWTEFNGHIHLYPHFLYFYRYFESLEQSQKHCQDEISQIMTEFQEVVRKVGFVYYGII